MKLRERDMKNFSENLNHVFNILNRLTDSEVFQSTLIDLNDGEGPLLHIKVCGRDSVWDDKLECQDQGMMVNNKFIDVLKGVGREESNPMYESILINNWKEQNGT